MKDLSSNLKRVLYSQSHNEIYVDDIHVVTETRGSISFVEYMKSVDIEVVVGVVPFTSENLAGIEVVILNSPDNVLTENEIDALVKFVKDGKSVLFILPYYGDMKNATNVNYVLSKMQSDVYFANTFIQEGTLKIRDHEITKGLEPKLTIESEKGKMTPIVPIGTLAVLKDEGVEVFLDVDIQKGTVYEKGRARSIPSGSNLERLETSGGSPVALIKKVGKGNVCLVASDIVLMRFTQMFQRTIIRLLGKPIQFDAVPKLEEIGRSVLEFCIETNKAVEDLEDWEIFTACSQALGQAKPIDVKTYLTEEKEITLANLSKEERQLLDIKAIGALKNSLGRNPDIATLVKFGAGIDEAKTVIAFIKATVDSSNEQINDIPLFDDEIRDVDRDSGRVLRFMHENPKAKLREIAFKLDIGPLKVRLIQTYLKNAIARPYRADLSDISDSNNIALLSNIFKLRKKASLTFVELLSALEAGPMQVKRAIYTYELMKSALEPTIKEYFEIDKIAVKLCKESNIDKIVDEGVQLVDIIKAINYMKKLRVRLVRPEELLLSKEKRAQVSDILFKRCKSFVDTTRKVPTPEELIAYDKTIGSYSIVATALSIIKHDETLGQAFVGMVKSTLPEISKMGKDDKEVYQCIMDMTEQESFILDEEGLNNVIKEIKTSEIQSSVSRKKSEKTDSS